jgi:uncharacterized protein
MNAREIIERLGLVPHPAEGGYFKETWRASESAAAAALPARYGAPRAFGTAIYYVLSPDTFSALHRLQSDEVFHFYLGDAVEMLQLAPDRTGRVVVIGNDLAAGERPQIVAPRGTWQGSRLREGGSVALLGATVAPGFEATDFEHGDRAALTARYPQFAGMIAALTR